MSDRKLLAGAIALCAVVYFLTHLHVPMATDHGVFVVTNTITGYAKECGVERWCTDNTKDVDTAKPVSTN